MTADKMVDFWDEESDLNTKVVIALTKAFNRKPRPGWIRSNSDDVAEALATLSNENRALRNDVERLASQAAHTMPSVSILLNGATELALTYVPDGKLTLSQTPKPEPIEWKDISDELKPFLRIEEVESYNSKLPPQPEIEENYQLLRGYERCEQTKCDLEIIVLNTGQAKARELYVDLVFPESVLVMEKYEYEKLTLPDFSLPESPIPKAEAKLRESKRRKSVYEMMNDLSQLHGIVHHSVLRDMSPLPRELSLSAARGRSLDVKDRKMTIWLKDLMHTRRSIFDGAIVIPREPGVFEIEVSVISEEMNAPTKFSIPLKISKSE